MVMRLHGGCNRFPARSFRFREVPLYPALHRLENRGLVKSEWKETDNGRDAKFYRLTRKGRVHLNAQAASWQRLAEAVGLILSLAEEGAR